MPQLPLSWLLFLSVAIFLPATPASSLRPYIRSPLFQPNRATLNMSGGGKDTQHTVMAGDDSFDEVRSAAAAVAEPSSARPALKSHASMSLFRFGAETPTNESKGYWNRQRRQFLQELAAECLGTFIIVQLGTGVVMADIFAGATTGLFQIAAVWIIAVTVAICCTASISGAHLNPAISISFALLRRSKQFGWSKVLPYTMAQTAGAILGSWVNLLMYAPLITQFEATNGIVRSSANAVVSARAFGEYYVDPVTTVTAFFAEAFGTAVLAGVIFALTHPANDTTKHNVYIPPFIGMTVGALITVIAPLTQAGFNPARDFGPRIVAYAAGWTGVAFQNCWVYIVAPLVGAPIGAAIVDKLLYANQGSEKVETAATTHD